MKIILVLIFFGITISGHDNVPADAYKKLVGEIEIAHEDLVGIVKKQNDTIRAQLVEIIQLKRQLKERSVQKKIEEKC